jgi:hypothetical protein
MQFFSNTCHRTLDTTESNNYKINTTNSIKFLGIIIESSLRWKENIDYTNSKLNSLAYMVLSLRPVLGLKVIKQIYFSYVHKRTNSVGLVRKRSVQTERPPHVGEVSANFCG